jgi:hypothetical protein
VTCRSRRMSAPKTRSVLGGGVTRVVGINRASFP